MERLSQHIDYLLTRHDCVVLPGFGAFINIYHAPRFDNEKRLLTPPGCEVRFNAAIKEDDGLLAKSIARKERISFREASDELNKLVVALVDALYEEGELTIGRLGIIKKGDEGNLHFHPFKTAEKYAIDLGLVSVPFHFLSSDRPDADTFISIDTADKIDEKNSEASNKMVTEVPEDFYPSHPQKQLNFDKNYYIPLNKIFTKICATFLVCLIIFAVFWVHPGIKNENRENRASVLPIDKMIDTSIPSSQEGKSEENVTISVKKIFDYNSLDTIRKEKDERK